MALDVFLVRLIFGRCYKWSFGHCLVLVNFFLYFATEVGLHLFVNGSLYFTEAGLYLFLNGMNGSLTFN